MNVLNNDGWNFIRKAAVADQDTWLSVHHKVTFADGKPPIYPGTAHQQVRTALQEATYWAQRGHCVYLAQGLFRNPGEMRPPRPYPNAIRQEPNLVACKNLYMDLDVKEGGYSSSNEALKAMKAFVAGAKLPMPTIIVGSGNGGFHVYWTMDETFEPREFRNLAGKLISAALQFDVKFDRQCTSDPQRLLRVPGTWNFKTGEGKPVKLLHLADYDIKLDDMRKALEPYKTVTVLHPKGNSKSKLNEDLTGGMGKSFPPVSIDEVAENCPFLKETLEQGGEKLVGDGHWHQMAAIACHTDDPHKTVHRLCEKNAFYDFDATEKKLGDAQRARENRETIGPPLCATIANGTSHCAACPHFNLGTTPLALPFKLSKPKPNRNNQTIDADMPENHYRDGEGMIWTWYTNTKTGEREDVPAFNWPIIQGTAYVEAGKPSFMFCFDTIQGEQQVTKRIPTTFTSGTSAFLSAFAAEGMTITVKPEVAIKFMGNYLELLQKSRNSLIRVPAFGWASDHNGQLGFAYAGKFFSPAGEFRASHPDAATEHYKVMGDDKVWTELMNLILTPDRPDLACMVAASFGAPLVYMTGENGFLVGLWSTESGIGKTTSLMAGQAIWAKPILGGLNDTVNYTFSKCATIRHLPVIYDEIKGDKQIKSMVELVFQLTRGSEKGRSGRLGEMRIVREFETLCAYAGNSSIVDAVREYHQGTDADWLRMFEMQAIVKKSEDPKFTAEVKERLLALKLNYGGIGLKYAAYLGKEQPKIAKALMSYQADLATKLGVDPQQQRFWLAAVSSVLLGAHLANSQGYCKFPLNAMKAYMVGEYLRMANEISLNPNDLGTDIALKNTMGVFLSEKLPRNLIILDKTAKSGRPTKNFAKIKNIKQTDAGWGVLEVQVSGDPLTIKISDKALGEWCYKNNRPKSALCTQLKKKVNARLLNVTIGSGTHLATAKQNSWVIEATGTIFEDILESVIQHDLMP